MFIYRLIAISALFVFSHSSAAQEERHIHINGEHLSAEDIVLMDQTLGSITPNGFYWINFNTGAWGYEGNETVMGNIMQHNQQYTEQYNAPAESNQASSRPKISNWDGGGYVQGEECSYVSVAGTSMRVCD